MWIDTAHLPVCSLFLCFVLQKPDTIFAGNGQGKGKQTKSLWILLFLTNTNQKGQKITIFWIFCTKPQKLHSFCFNFSKFFTKNTIFSQATSLVIWLWNWEIKNVMTLFVMAFFLFSFGFLRVGGKLIDKLCVYLLK